MKEKLIICYAFFMVMLYVMPQSIAIPLEILLLAYLFFKNSNIEFYLEFKWYLFFWLTLLILEFSKEGIEGNNYLSSTFHCLLMVLTISKLIGSQEHIEIFIKSLSVSGFFFCIMLFPMLSDAMQGRRLQNVSSDIGYLANAVSIGYSLMFISMSQLWSLMHVKKKYKLIIAVFFAISLFLILLTGTRKALIAPIIFIALHIYFVYRKYVMSLLFYSFVFVFIVYIGIDFIMNNEMLYNIIGVRLEGLLGLADNSSHTVDESTMIRMELFSKSQRLFLESNWFTGVGVARTIKQIGTHPHINYMTMLCFGGIITFISYYWFHVKLLLKYLRMKSKNNLDLFFLCLLLSLFFVDATATTFNINLFIIFLSLACVNLRYGKIKKNI